MSNFAFLPERDALDAELQALRTQIAEIRAESETRPLDIDLSEAESRAQDTNSRPLKMQLDERRVYSVARYPQFVPQELE